MSIIKSNSRIDSTAICAITTYKPLEEEANSCREPFST